MSPSELHYLSTEGIQTRRPYPTKEELDKVRDEYGDGYIIYGGYGCINIYEIPT
ncbi:MAG: hypothetical protein ACTSQF_00040 [Candidatus Heimdallarchaeaceae archaeon]